VKLEQKRWTEKSCSTFYSYGEISPFTRGVPCELHNQMTTITAFLEIS
jgi:hypothetical protein